MTNILPLLYSADIESPPSDEEDDIRHVLEAMDKSLQKSLEASGHFQRDVHVKANGCASGTLHVLPNLPQELAQGLFAREHVFSAIVRFSNAASQPRADFLPDGRGMAIKVLNIEGAPLLAESDGSRSQDFVMVNHPNFVARNVKDYLQLEKALVADKSEKLQTLTNAFTGGDWNPLHWHWREAATTVQAAAQLPAHPASITYFSMAPIRFGKYVAKYRAKPTGESASSFLNQVAALGKDTNALRQMLANTLRSEPVKFDFQIQLRTSAETMPVEDALIAWPESESPFQTVAELQLPKQDITVEKEQEAYDELSFNVWHALVEHQPLGGINRLRRAVYPHSVAWRRRKSDVASKGKNRIGTLH